MKFFKTLRDSNIGPGPQYAVFFKDPVLGNVYATQDEVFLEKGVNGRNDGDAFLKTLAEVTPEEVPKKLRQVLVESVKLAGWEHWD